MNRLFVFLLACVIAQFSYGQKELTIKEMEDSMAQGNLNIQVDLAYAIRVSPRAITSAYD